MNDLQIYKNDTCGMVRQLIYILTMLSKQQQYINFFGGTDMSKM